MPFWFWCVFMLAGGMVLSLVFNSIIIGAASMMFAALASTIAASNAVKIFQDELKKDKEQGRKAKDGILINDMCNRGV